MEKKIVVPEGMLDAAWEHLMGGSGMSSNPKVSTRVIIEGALRWLDGELESLWSSYNQPFGSLSEAVVDRYSATRNGQHQAIEAVRRMFLAPEQEDYADRILKNASHGYTPTHAELDKIWDNIFRAGHGWTPPEMRGASPKATEPSVPEAVKDIVYIANPGVDYTMSMSQLIRESDRRVLEAYRRGQKSGRRCHHDEVPNGAVCTNCGATHVDQYIKRNGVGGAA